MRMYKESGLHNRPVTVKRGHRIPRYFRVFRAEEAESEEQGQSATQAREITGEIEEDRGMMGAGQQTRAVTACFWILGSFRVFRGISGLTG